MARRIHHLFSKDGTVISPGMVCLEFDTLLTSTQVVVPHPGVYPGLCKKAHKDSLPFSHRISHSVEKFLLNKKQK